MLSAILWDIRGVFRYICGIPAAIFWPMSSYLRLVFKFIFIFSPSETHIGIAFTIRTAQLSIDSIAFPILTQRLTRSFSVASRRCNLVSDLYIQHIKDFKPSPISAKDAEEAVKPFKLPAKPTVPESEISADGVSAYESAEVETQSAPSGEAAPAEDWFVFEEEEEHH